MCQARTGEGVLWGGDGTRRSSLPESGGRGEELVPDSASKIHIPWEKRKRTWCFSA